MSLPQPQAQHLMAALKRIRMDRIGSSVRPATVSQDEVVLEASSSAHRGERERPHHVADASAFRWRDGFGEHARIGGCAVCRCRYRAGDDQQGVLCRAVVFALVSWLCASRFLAWSAAVLPKIDLPKDSPVAVLSADYKDSNETARGGAMLLDLHAALSLRNSSQRRIRGITLLVTAQDVTPGGKGSVTGPVWMSVRTRLFRAHRSAVAAALAGRHRVPVQISLDGVLFEDLSFYGPDKLSSRRTLDGIRSAAGPQVFQIAFGRGRSGAVAAGDVSRPGTPGRSPSMDVQVVRGARATNFEPEKQVQFAFLQLPDSPIEPRRHGAYRRQ